MRELDVLLQAFLESGYEALDNDDKARFESLLMLPDPELAAYLFGRAPSPDASLDPLILAIRSSLYP